MKKSTMSTMSTIALGAAVLLLSGTFAAAAERVDTGRNYKSNATRSQGRTAGPVDVAAGAIEDINESGPQAGGPTTTNPQCDTKAGALSSMQSFLEPLICLINPVNGNTVMCLRNDPVVAEGDCN